uniref:Homeobox domain-containing protein n=1 Tax=Loxodonta africana TaxID=9785 RepID=G3U957_LOXAF
CWVPVGSLELVQLWNDIHYILAMRRLGVAMLTLVQKFHCRERNLPQPSLCPEGLRSRNFLREVRQKLQDLASGMSTNFNKAQQETLSSETSLSEEQVYNWFASYRQKQRALLQHVELAWGTSAQGSDVWGRGLEPLCPSGDLQADPWCVDRSQWSRREEKGPPRFPETTQGLWAPLLPALGLTGDKVFSKPPALRSLQGALQPSRLREEMDIDSHLTSLPPLLPPEFIFPQIPHPEPAQAMSSLPQPASALELSQPQPSTQVEWSDGQASNDSLWGAWMLFEYSEGSLG